MANHQENHSTSVRDVKQMGTMAAVASLGYIFWIVGGMEMVERLAYYGVKTVAALYAKDPVSKGGLGITLTEFGSILGTWALVQTFVPVLTGGLSDRFGYKETIFASTVIKIMGYLIMAFFASYWGFFWGAIVLAFGTGIFKPGLQGTLAKVTNRRNSSVAWGMFYQTVNIGGFIGPLVAAQMRQIEWEYVFFVNAAVISLNFLLLLTYKEPGKEERLERRRAVKAGEIEEENLVLDSLREFFKPTMFFYVLMFSAFWFMFNSFFDILPPFIDDWVDTSVIVTDLFGAGGTDSALAINLMGMNQAGTIIQPEGLVNLNAGLIMLICFLVTGWSARLKAVNSMALGTFLASTALLLFAGFSWPWIFVIGIIAFSFGEMLSSPKFLEYLGNIAPSNKKAMYLGFSQAAVGIGWIAEGYLGPMWLDKWASKDRFSRELLESSGMNAETVAAIPGGEAYQELIAFTGRTGADLTAQMYASHDVGMVWYVMGIMGLLSALGMVAYGKWSYRVLASEPAAE